MTVSFRTTALRASAVVALSGLTFIHCGGDKKNAEAPTETMPSAAPPQPEDADAATTRNAPSLTEPAASAESATNDPTDPTPPPSTTRSAESLSDEQIAGVTDAANTAEIAQGKLAQTKAKDPGIKRFAAMMIKHHGAAKQKQAKLKIKPQDSGVSTTLQADAASTLNALKAGEGKDFDRVYIASQVDEHQKVLDTINDKLLPNAKNPDLKAYLEEVKTRVEEHLTDAKQLQHSLDSKNASSMPTHPRAG